MELHSFGLAAGALIVGLVVLIWSADRFVDGAAASARHFGMSPLLIGMVIVGFGTSMPEMVVSAFASYEGNAGLALGNAYGSNITNIALILGITALITPIQVDSGVVRLEIPILLGVTGLTGWQLYDGRLSQLDAVVLLLVFAGLMGWTVWQSARKKSDELGEDMLAELTREVIPLRKALLLTFGGLLFLIAASRVIVWGAVEIATQLGVGDLIIGLTVVALGTSLPELASSVAAARKNEHDIAFGNIIGSNLFNTLVVVGIAGGIAPITVPPELLTRDYPVMVVVTFLLFVMVFGFHKAKRLNRVEGAILLVVFVGYTAYLISTVT